MRNAMWLHLYEVPGTNSYRQRLTEAGRAEGLKQLGVIV